MRRSSNGVTEVAWCNGLWPRQGRSGPVLSLFKRIIEHALADNTASRAGLWFQGMYPLRILTLTTLTLVCCSTTSMRLMTAPLPMYTVPLRRQSTLRRLVRDA
jgi:hypothetical protein